VRKKVLILVPLTWESVPRSFYKSVMGMALWNYERGSGHQLAIIDGQSTFIDLTRDHMMDIAHTQKTDYDYILQLDADQVYPSATIEILVGHIDEEHPVVAGLTPSRQYGYPLVFNIEDKTPPQYKRIKNFDINQVGLVRVEGTGLGGVMLHRSVLDKVPYPRFVMQYSDYIRRPVGDDVTFFSALKKADIPVYVDPQLRFEHIVVGVRRVEDWYEPSA